MKNRTLVFTTTKYTIVGTCRKWCSHIKVLNSICTSNDGSRAIDPEEYCPPTLTLTLTLNQTLTLTGDNFPDTSNHRFRKVIYPKNHPKQTCGLWLIKQETKAPKGDYITKIWIFSCSQKQITFGSPFFQLILPFLFSYDLVFLWSFWHSFVC